MKYNSDSGGRPSVTLKARYSYLAKPSIAMHDPITSSAAQLAASSATSRTRQSQPMANTRGADVIEQLPGVRYRCQKRNATT